MRRRFGGLLVVLQLVMAAAPLADARHHRGADYRTHMHSADGYGDCVPPCNDQCPTGRTGWAPAVGKRGGSAPLAACSILLGAPALTVEAPVAVFPGPLGSRAPPRG
jgi:hypothetical protein